MDKEVEIEFEDLWKSDNYALVRSQNSFGYTIHNIKKDLYVLIDNDDIVPTIIEKMLENNVKIYENYEDLPPPTDKRNPVTLEEWKKENEKLKNYFDRVIAIQEQSKQLKESDLRSIAEELGLDWSLIQDVINEHPTIASMAK